MRPTIAVVRDCCQTSAARTCTHLRLPRRTQLQPASFYEHQFPLSCKTLSTPGGSGERAAVTLTRVASYRCSPRECNDAQLFAQSRTLRIRQLNGLYLSIVVSSREDVRVLVDCSDSRCSAL